MYSCRRAADASRRQVVYLGYLALVRLAAAPVRAQLDQARRVRAAACRRRRLVFSYRLTRRPRRPCAAAVDLGLARGPMKPPVADRRH